MRHILIPSVICAGIVVAGAAAAKPHNKAHHEEVAVVHTRTEVVVAHGWPIHRAMPTVVVRPVRTPVRVVTATYLTPVIWHPLIVPRPAPAQLIWEDKDHLTRGEDWTELTFNAQQRGSRLFLGVESGRVQLQFAEIVFGNGQTRVVDFQENTREQGFYPVLDFKEMRDVDHVRLVARAKTDVAQISLHMQG